MQLMEVPLQVPAGVSTALEHVAPHTVPEGWKPSDGQAAAEPVQLSATSQRPAEGRQTRELGWKPSGGQAAAEPVQLSGTSQAPTEGRQTTVLAAKPSVGQ